MNKKLVLLGPYPPPYGGVSTYISTLYELLRNQGVNLWTFGKQELKGANVFFMKDKRFEIVPLLIRQGCASRIVDCTHFLVEVPSLLVPVWIALKFILRFDWFKVIHDGTLPSRYRTFSPLRKILFHLAIYFVDEFIVVSEDLLTWFRTEIRVKQEISLIKSLLPIPDQMMNVELSSDIKDSLRGFMECRKRVCSIGVFTSEYGFKDVASAVEKLRLDSGEDIGLIFIDGAFMNDESYRFGVLDRRPWISVLTEVPQPVVLQILKRSHLFVRAFGLESYGLSRIEAMWCGVPVVATKAGETRGMRLYDSGDEVQLQRQMKQALFDAPPDSGERWPELFQKEAEENLKTLLSKIGLKPCGQWN